MNIYDALNQLSWKKKEYFLWKHNLSVLRKEPLTEEEILHKLQVNSLAYMKKWEKSQEYHALVNLYIESQAAKDLEDIYVLVKEKALTGEEKAIKMLLDLQKQVQSFNKSNNKLKTTKTNDKDEYEDLEID